MRAAPEREQYLGVKMLDAADVDGDCSVAQPALELVQPLEKDQVIGPGQASGNFEKKPSGSNVCPGDQMQFVVHGISKIFRASRLPDPPSRIRSR